MATKTCLILALLQPQGEVTYGDVALANNMNQPSLQGQALEKVFSAGPRSVPAILEFVKDRGHNALTQVFTRRLAEIPDPRIASLLAVLLEDPDFFWRPTACWGLAEMAGPEYAPLFRKLLKDRLWGVRAAAAYGLGALREEKAIPDLRQLLGDEVFDVRAEAARVLLELGDESGIPVLVAALRDATRWFDIDYGQIAREKAFLLLRMYTGFDFGYRPWEPAAQREPMAKAWEEWVARKFPDWKQMVPQKAWPQDDRTEYLFGFELRSCQRGDFFFRVGTKGELVLGYFNLTRAQLSPEEFEAFRREMDRGIAFLDPFQPPGRPGCDFEKYYALTEEGGYSTVMTYVQGRPGEMDRFVAFCRRLLAEKFGEGVAREFDERATLFREPE